MEKIKTSITIDRKLWEELKLKVGSRGGLKALSRAVEEAIEEEVADLLIIEALEREVKSEELPLTISPVKPRVATDAGKSVRELRELRI